MELTNLVLAILGHVLATVFYIVRKLGFSSSHPKAVVDRSSIIERKEELKQLWEKKMATEQAAAVGESGAKEEEEELKKQVKHSETNGVPQKIANGTVPTEKNVSGPAGIQAPEKISVNGTIEVNKTDEVKLSKIDNQEKGETTRNEVETSKINLDSQTADEGKALKVETVVDTSEVEVIEITEKVYTSTHQQTLIITKTEEEEKVSVVEESEKKIDNVQSTEETQEDFEELERRIEAEESELQKSEKQVLEQPAEVTESLAEKQQVEIQETETMPDKDNEEEDNQCLSEQLDSDSLEGGETNSKGDEFNEAIVLDNQLAEGERELTMNDDFENDTYRPLEEFLPPRENDNIEEDIATSETAFVQNGETEEKSFDDHFVLDTRELVSPISDSEKKDAVGKKSRIHTLGVQKTEQPYNTCTTETKIAMEIREMREREEELKQMRERQAQISPVPPPPPPQKSTTLLKAAPVIQKPVSPIGYSTPNAAKISTPGYRPSSVFGPRAVSATKDENKFNRNFTKESAVEKEIRIAKDREEEMRKQKGLPPREDDSYVKPSQVKSSQAKVFGKINNAETSRLLATAKIQHEIEEQTMREMALRESGHIQTLSTERTDSKVTKLKTLESECTSPTLQNGNSPVHHTNGVSTNGHISPEYGYKRSTPSPTGSNYSTSSYSVSRNAIQPSNKGISMQKFIASRGKETTFNAPRNGPFVPKSEYQDSNRALPEPGKLKRTVSVESKIQQEIMEMKMREDELKMIHSGQPEKPSENGDEYDAMSTELINGQQGDVENSCPRRNNLIAQWEQMIQNAEGRA